MGKPILFHDVDGVLFGEYGPVGYEVFQLRPGIHSWFKWVMERFQIAWLTTWQEDMIKNLLRQQYMGHLMKHMKVAPWYNYLDKETYLAEEVKNKLDWYWIDDKAMSDDKLIERGLNPTQVIRVNDKGQDELEHIKLRLATILDDRFVR